jgi:threonine dehydrogenase-like Zn-dependent dehydrogenase
MRLARGCRPGGDHGANVYEYALVAVIQGLTGGPGIDRAIECDGAAETSQPSVQATKRGGKRLIGAYCASPMTLDRTIAPTLQRQRPSEAAAPSRRGLLWLPASL